MAELGDEGEYSEAIVNGFIFAFLCLLAGCLIMNHMIGHKYHPKYISEAGAVVAVGLVISTFLSSLFVGLSLYALAQAHLSYSLSMAECLAFGALISATDPVSVLAVFEQLKVDPLMFYLVFGESVLNDAVALVLFNIFSKFVGTEAFTTASMGFAIVDFLIIFFGSMAVGFLFGCLSALLFKHIDLRHSIYEMGVYLLLAYIPSLFGTAIELSGIVCILFTGMFSRHYTHRNLSVKGQALAFFIFSLLAVLSETAVFLELGLSVFSGEKEYFHPLLIIWTLLLILIGRALNIYPISFLVNRFTSVKVGRNVQHMLWFAGLRGAMAYACSKQFSNVFGNQPIIEATTMVIVLITVFGFGTFTITMLEKMEIPLGVPATDAVNLSENQSRILALEEKYLVPLLQRPLEFSSQATPWSPNYRGRHGHDQEEGGKEGGPGDAVPSAPELSPVPYPRNPGERLRRESSGEGFMANDHIDRLFGYNARGSIEMSASGAGIAEGDGDDGQESQRNVI
ncbi:monovalent cation:proton antiporter1 family [Nannochloropsis gaditana CCMP526]|uniref:monovalent cation:proton antiporter1 family n=1 Tax=Nannochloropsis gaditana (strain CCMP526) TaxID=1093141 RepID=UPI00029F4EAE|nr:monovalent cation:proton antiporter1 family [Nannochloropsis gaditana CCMP526]EKU22377.1 monovalent cation:proton antiporter1 family [Nannochloropsis gaditana CCMP526]|eukprot:XP_005853985.1 monovalent cation:proton antiporter1 family [Nannochloropsis gaditana CCMP526]